MLLQEAAYLLQAWQQRIIWDGSDAKLTTVAGSLQTQLGLTDTELCALPAEALKKLALTRTQGTLDLKCLNSERLSHLRLDFAIMEAAVAATTAAGNQQGDALRKSRDAVTSSSSNHPAGNGCRGGSRPVTPARSSTAVDVVSAVCNILKGNTTLTSLTLKNIPSPAAARALAEAALSLSSRLEIVTVHGLTVPVAALIGRQLHGLEHSSTAPPAPLLTELDVSFTGQSPSSNDVGLSSQHAAFLAPLLHHCSSLTSLSLGPTHHLPEEVAVKLVAAVTKLNGLRLYNGKALQTIADQTPAGMSQTSSGNQALQTTSSSEQNNKRNSTHAKSNVDTAAAAAAATSASHYSSGGAVNMTEGDGKDTSSSEVVVVDCCGIPLGPVGGALLGQSWCSTSGPSMPSVLNATGKMQQPQWLLRVPW